MRERTYSLDALKFFCIVGIVCIHVNSFVGINLGFAGSEYLGYAIKAICRVCVPLFFLCSGYFFYSKSNLSYSINYIGKMIKILFSWIFIYMLFETFIIILTNIKSSNYIFSNVYNYISKFRLNDIYYADGIIPGHLWYLCALIFIIPILYLAIKKNFIGTCLLISLTLNILGVLIPVFIDPSLWIKFRDAIFFGLFYSVLGVYISKYEKNILNKLSCISKTKFISIISILFLISIFECLFYSIKLKCNVDYFLSTIPLVSIIFFFFISNKSMFKNSVTSKLGKYTLGIYLVHILVIRVINLFLSKFNATWIMDTLLWQFLYLPIVLSLSFIIYQLIQIAKGRFHTLSKKSINNISYNKDVS